MGTVTDLQPAEAPLNFPEKLSEPVGPALVTVDTRSAQWRPGLVEGLAVLPLCEFRTEHTALVLGAPGTRFQAHRHWGGEEIYVIDGTFEDELGRYPAGSWIRSPHLSQHRPFSTDGCTILVKTGHLLAGAEPVAMPG